MARNKSQDYAMQFLIHSLATFFGVYFALIAVTFVEKLNISALLIGAVTGTIGLFIITKIITRGISIK